MTESQISKKIIRSFVVHIDIFLKFKEVVAAQGYSNFSEIIEYLILCYLKDPNSFDFRNMKKS